MSSILESDSALRSKGLEYVFALNDAIKKTKSKQQQQQNLCAHKGTSDSACLRKRGTWSASNLLQLFHSPFLPRSVCTLGLLPLKYSSCHAFILNPAISKNLNPWLSVETAQLHSCLVVDIFSPSTHEFQASLLHTETTSKQNKIKQMNNNDNNKITSKQQQQQTLWLPHS